MKAANITVNLPGDGRVRYPEKTYEGTAGETPDQIIQRVTALHPDWTSMVLVITH
jgi:hypothetical protein